MRLVFPVLLALLIAGCGSSPARRPLPGQMHSPRVESVQAATAPARPFNPCAPTREHRDSDYTPGGLYAPGVADGGPSVAIDVSGVREPVPRAEPRSRYGNRSPYTVLGKSYRVLDSAEGYHERGVASWYGTKFNGRATSSGELYDICVFSAAHKTLPLPSFVRVTNLDNGRSLVVRVNDRGPFHSGRVMDLSYAAAVRLGVDRTGTARVELQAIGADGSVASPGGADSSDDPHVPPPRRVEPRPRDGVDESADSLVQVGSFGEKDNARRLKERLEDAGVDDVDIDHAQAAGQDVWRVRVGPVPARELQPLLQRLRQLGLPEPRVLRQ